MSTPVGAVPSARERILGAASELFYARGINATGVDAVIERAGTAKASLYNNFDGKDDLVVAYLEAARERWYREVSELDRPDASRVERLDVVFAALERHVASKDFHGCPFIAALSEFPESDEVRAAVARYRATLLDRFGEILGLSSGDTLVVEMGLLYDGALTSAKITRGLDGVRVARALAGKLAAHHESAALETCRRTRGH
ncbi:MAG TPA: TetR/AcrR family transcriptional regulator [Acidimicrobiales bacterium]|nr:TetR/AcrR family transcriptional regulator [Acidimicrobiales bacterium]